MRKLGLITFLVMVSISACDKTKPAGKADEHTENDGREHEAGEADKHKDGDGDKHKDGDGHEHKDGEKHDDSKK